MNYKEVVSTLKTIIERDDDAVEDKEILIANILIEIDCMTSNDVRNFLNALIAFANMSERDSRKIIDAFCFDYDESQIEEREKNGEYDELSSVEEDIFPI